MALTEQEQTLMYGCTEASIDQEVENNPFVSDVLMHCMAVLSDTQAVMRGNPEEARQWINKTKYIITRVRSQSMQSLKGGSLTVHLIGE
jgi:hypothetical protein